MPEDLIEFLLNDLRRKPGMYLTAYSFAYLCIYLGGVQITCWHLDKTGKYSERFFGEHGFLRWSWEKYKLGSPSSQLNHYNELAEGDDKRALELFFDDLQEFRSAGNC